MRVGVRKWQQWSQFRSSFKEEWWQNGKKDWLFVRKKSSMVVEKKSNPDQSAVMTILERYRQVLTQTLLLN